MHAIVHVSVLGFSVGLSVYLVPNMHASQKQEVYMQLQCNYLPTFIRMDFAVFVCLLKKLIPMAS